MTYFIQEHTSAPSSKPPPGRFLIRDSGSSISITTATDQPGFLFPVSRTTPITVRRKITEESSLSQPPDQNKSRKNETKRPANRLLPDDSGHFPHSNIVVTDVYYEDVLNSSTTNITPTLNNLHVDQNTDKTSTSSPKQPANESSTANATTGSSLSASMKIISQTTQPLFNGKKVLFRVFSYSTHFAKCLLAL